MRCSGRSVTPHCRSGFQRHFMRNARHCFNRHRIHDPRANLAPRPTLAHLARPQTSRQPIDSPPRSGTTGVSPAGNSAGSVHSSRRSVTFSVLRGKP